MIEYDRNYEMQDSDAQARLKSLAAYWEAKWGFGAQWEGDHTAHLDGKVKGVRFKGSVRISNGSVSARIDAGFLAEKLGAKKYVTRKVDDYLDTKNSLASLNARIPR